MALMPKRVKYRKSQRGRIRGNAVRGNTVAFGDWGLQSLDPGHVRADDDRSLSRRRESVHSRRREAVHPHLPAEVGDGPSAGNANGYTARANRTTGSPSSNRARCCSSWAACPRTRPANVSRGSLTSFPCECG